MACVLRLATSSRRRNGRLAPGRSRQPWTRGARAQVAAFVICSAFSDRRPTRRRAFSVSGLVLGELLDVPRRSEDDIGHSVGVRDRNRVRGTRDFYDLAGPGALGHEPVSLHRDVLVELREHEPRRDRLPRRWPGALVQRPIPQRPLGYGHEGGLLGGSVCRELLVVLLLADVEGGTAVGQRDGRQRIAKRTPGETGGELTDVLALLRCERPHEHERLDVVLAKRRVADDGTAVGVANQDDGPLDRLEDASDELGVAREAADRVRRSDRGVALLVQAADNAVPTRGLGEGAVDEDHGRDAHFRGSSFLSHLSAFLPLAPRDKTPWRVSSNYYCSRPAASNVSRISEP